jgi:hypothetical protein
MKRSTCMESVCEKPDCEGATIPSGLQASSGACYAVDCGRPAHDLVKLTPTSSPVYVPESSFRMGSLALAAGGPLRNPLALLGTVACRLRRSIVSLASSSFVSSEVKQEVEDSDQTCRRIHQQVLNWKDIMLNRLVLCNLITRVAGCYPVVIAIGLVAVLSGPAAKLKPSICDQIPDIGRK